MRAALAKISTSQIEAVKLQRAQQVSKSTVDKDLAVLKAFFNWCIGRGLAASNPVRPVKLFREDNARLRYLTREEYERLLEAARRTIKTSPYLEEKLVLAAHTGLRRGSLFNLRWDQLDFANRVMRIPRTKSGRPLSLPLNATALASFQKLHAARAAESASPMCSRTPRVLTRASRSRTSRTDSTRPWSWPGSRTSRGTISGTPSPRG